MEFDHHSTCQLREREDARRWADYEFANTDWLSADLAPNSRNVEMHQFDRLATDTERALLAVLVYSVPDPLVTTVTFISRTTRRRTWPATEGTEK